MACLIWQRHMQVTALRQVSAGQGLMLETSSRRLMQPGMPHHNCPDKARFLLEIQCNIGLTIPP